MSANCLFGVELENRDDFLRDVYLYIYIYIDIDAQVNSYLKLS